MYEIITKEMLTPTICRMKVYAPRLAASALPGQFLIVRATENGERIPLTISDYDKEAGTVTIVTQQIGASSSEIISFEEGESFKDVVGPLGIPSDFTEMPEEELDVPVYIADFKTLLAMNRSNGGATYFSDGYLVRKWSYRSLPDMEGLQETFDEDETETVIYHDTKGSLGFQGFLLYVFAVMLLL